MADLAKPEVVAADPDAREIMRVFASRGTQVTVLGGTCWKDPAAWGIVLADIIHHVASAYAEKGGDYGESFARVQAGLAAELAHPTSRQN